MNKRFLVVVFLLSVMIMLNSASAAAQSCAIKFLDESSKIDLNQAGICEAANGFIQRGFEVYVFVTDADPRTEDEWFNIRDRVEVAWNIYNPSNDTFSKRALAIEITTVTSYPWGQDIAFGGYLFNTPLDNDTAIGMLEGQLKNAVTTGDVNRAISSTLTSAYNTAFPTVASVPTSVPVTPQQIVATKVVEVLPTRVANEQSGDFKPETAQNNAAPLSIPPGVIMVTVLVLAAGTAIAVFVFIINPRRQLLAHIAYIRHNVSALLLLLEKSLTSQGEQASPLVQLWQVYGGENSKVQNDQFMRLSKESLGALNEAMSLFTELKRQSTPWGMDSLRQLVYQWEMLYLTVVGVDSHVLSMTPAEIAIYMDSFSEVVVDGTEDSPLVNQIREIRRQYEGAGHLQMQLHVVDGGQVHQQGVLGNIINMKNLLQDLQVAKDEAPVALADVESVFASLKQEVDIPEGLTAAIFSPIADVIKSAKDALAKEAWVEAQSLADVAMKTIAELQRAIGKFIDQTARVSELAKQLDQIAQQGYSLQPVQSKIDTSAQAKSQSVQTLTAGQYADAVNDLNVMVSDLESAIAQMQFLITLRTSTAQRLQQLSNEVASVKSLLVNPARRDWEALQEYPRSNWETVAENYSKIEAILHELFDDPANASDLASTIAQLNSMQTQNFEEANRQMDGAFVSLANAKEALAAIQCQYQLVLKLQQDLQSGINNVREQYALLVEARDAEDSKIDQSVDQLIEQAQQLLNNAAQLQQQQEFVAGQATLKEAHQLIIDTAKSAHVQIAEIDKGVETLNQIRRRAKEAIQQAESSLEQLPSSVREDQHSNVLRILRTRLANAEREEGAIAGKQDKQWLKALELSIAAYERIETEGKSLQGDIQSTRRLYEAELDSVVKAISIANAAINNAASRVSSADARGAGSSLLSRARAGSLTAPTFGISLADMRAILQRVQEIQRLADQAGDEADDQIRRVQREREEQERREREERDRRRREDEERRRRMTSSLGSSSSSRSSSSFGSSTGRGSTSMGSSRRR